LVAGNLFECPSLLGSCFAFRHSNCFLTAGHCVRGLAADAVVVGPPTSKQLYQVGEIIAHEEADLAILRLAPDCWPGDVDVFYAVHHLKGIGGDFIAYGFPEDVLGPKDRKSTRLNSSHGSTSYAVFCLKKI